MPLPTTVQFARANEDNNDLPIVARNEISKPIVVMPHMATKAIKSEMPIKAPNHSDFPIVERKSKSPIVVMKTNTSETLTLIDCVLKLLFNR